MAAAAELFVRIAADVSQYQNAIRNLPMPLQGVQAAGAAAAGGLNQAGRAAETAAEGMRHAATAADSVGGASRDAAGGLSHLASTFAANLAADLAAHALMAAGAAMVDAGKRAVMLAGELEQSKVAFTTMLGSAAKADAFLRDLTQFAANTPFELRGLQDSSKRLLAFGFQAKDIIPIMTGVGNAVAGLGGGKATLDGVTLALGQMAAKGKVSAEEMGQLAERGIPAWKMLADRIGKSIPEAMKMAEKGMIPGAVAIEALVNGMNAKFPNMMAAQSKTMLGAWSNLKDGLDRVLTNIGTRVAETFNLTGIIIAAGALFAGLAKSLESNNFDGIFLAAQAAALGFGTAITVAVAPAVYTAVVGTMIPAIHALALAWAPAIAAALPYIGLAAAVAFAAVPIMSAWNDLKVTFRDVWGVVAQSAADAWKWVRQVYERMSNGAAELARSIASWLGGVFGGLGQELQAQMANLPGPVRDAMGKLGGLFSGFRVEASGHLAALGSDLGNVGASVGAAAMAAGRVLSDNLAYSWGGIGDSMRAVMNNVMGNVAASTLKVQDLVLNGSHKVAEAAAKAHKGHKAAMTEAAKDAKALAKAYEDLPKKLAVVGDSIQRAIQMGDLEGQIKAVTAGGNLLASTLKNLAQHGGAGSAQFKALQGELAGVADWLDTLKQRLAAYNATAKQLASYRGAYDGLSASLAGIAIEADALGPSFDRAGAQADALKKHLGDLVDLRKGGALISDVEIKQAAEAFGAAQKAAKAFQQTAANTKFMEDYAEGVAQIDRRIGNLGQSFAGAAEMADYTRRAWQDAGGQAGMSAEQIEQLRVKADEASLAAGRGGLAYESFAAAGAVASTSISNLRAALAGVGAALGVEMNDPLTAAAASAVNLAVSVGQVATSVGPAMQGIEGLSGTISTLMGSASAGPWALAAAAVAVVGVALYKLGEDTSKVRTSYDADIQAIVAQTVGSGNAIVDAWNWVGGRISDFAKGFRNVIDSLFGPSEAAAKAQDDLAKAMQGARNEAKRTGEEYINLHKSITSGLDGALKSAVRAFLDGTGSLTESLRTGIRDAILNGIIEATLQKGVIQAQFGRLFEDIALAMQKGEMGKVDSLIGQIGEKLPIVASRMETAFGSLKNTLDKAFSPTQGIMDARSKAYSDAQFQSGTLGSLDAAGLLKAKVSADEKALEALRAAGASQGSAFAGLLATLNKNRADLAAAEAAAKATKDGGKKDTSDAAKAIEAQQKAIREAYQGQMDAIGAKLQQVETNSTAGKGLIAQLNASRAAMEAALAAAAGTIPALAAGGVTTGPAMAMIGEGRYQEAVLPLSRDTYSQIAAGIAAAGGRSTGSGPGGSGGGSTTVINLHVNYTGSGKWTRDDARALGPLLVSELRAAGLGR